MKRLFVSGIPFVMTDEDLAELFRSRGVAVESAGVVRTPDRGVSRGFGFVELTVDQEIGAALRLNGLNLEGHILHVSRALPPAGRVNRARVSSRFVARRA